MLTNASLIRYISSMSCDVCKPCVRDFKSVERRICTSRRRLRSSSLSLLLVLGTIVLDCTAIRTGGGPVDVGGVW